MLCGPYHTTYAAKGATPHGRIDGWTPGGQTHAAIKRIDRSLSSTCSPNTQFTFKSHRANHSPVSYCSVAAGPSRAALPVVTQDRLAATVAAYRRQPSITLIRCRRVIDQSGGAARPRPWPCRTLALRASLRRLHLAGLQVHSRVRPVTRRLFQGGTSGRRCGGSAARLPGGAWAPGATTLHLHLAAAKGTQGLWHEEVGDLGYDASLQVTRGCTPDRGARTPF